MNVSSADVILSELESLGTEQARKTYQRHGVGDNAFGVSYSDLGKFQKKLKTNHVIALDLWNSGIHDAQILALMTADPQKADPKDLDQWVLTLSNYVMTDAFSKYVAETSFAQEKAEKWIQSDGEWISTAGWNVIGMLAYDDTTLPDSYFEQWLPIIERDLHGSKNRTRYAMNNVIIAIGSRNPALQAQAVETAKRIGKVEVDHGDTNCKTPNAITYIQKTVDHRMAKAAKAKAEA